MTKVSRRGPSPFVKNLALEFAKLATVVDDQYDSFVHRIGHHSIFGVFSKCCEGILRKPRQGFKLGITVAQLNKHLESDEFHKMRNRYVEIEGEEEEDYIGSYSFWRRRWRDPSDPIECKELTDGLKSLCKKFAQPGSAALCVDEGVFLSSIRAACIDAARRRDVQKALRAELESSLSPRCEDVSKKSWAQLLTEPSHKICSHFAKHKPLQKCSEIEEAKLAKRTREILEEDPFEVAKKIKYDHDFFNVLLPELRTECFDSPPPCCQTAPFVL
mmetsp:Transcript_40573/g.81310  ORF Transcript_40573/g.81310 Transcript_40573/m.81310 type:complete len:273 (-) Transcript_40573:27-845(-)